ncbi:MAG: uroporphyrinogen decarboxylase [Bacteroidota bacterium]
MEIKNDLVLRAAKGQPVSRYPVWLMRQAGRILPEYRKVRESVKDFKELVETPHLAAEVTIQPVDILGVDAAIIFSDILVVPDAMGFTYDMYENKGPVFQKTLCANCIDHLSIPDVNDRLGYVAEAIKITKKELNGRVPLIGFAGAPFTILSYIIEGQGSKTFSKARKLLYTHPDLCHTALQRITETTIAYLKMQVKAGADMVQLFDSWAGFPTPEQYNVFGVRYINEICDAITEVPVTVFAKGAWFARAGFAKSNCAVVGLDWNMDIRESRAIIGENKTLQGNLDPCALYGDFAQVKKETIKMLESFASGRHIANLGHGVYPDTDPEKVKCFVETVKEYKI